MTMPVAAAKTKETAASSGLIATRKAPKRITEMMSSTTTSAMSVASPRIFSFSSKRTDSSPTRHFDSRDSGTARTWAKRRVISTPLTRLATRTVSSERAAPANSDMSDANRMAASISSSSERSSKISTRSMITWLNSGSTMPIASVSSVSAAIRRKRRPVRLQDRQELGGERCLRPAGGAEVRNEAHGQRLAAPPFGGVGARDRLYLAGGGGGIGEAFRRHADRQRQPPVRAGENEGHHGRNDARDGDPEEPADEAVLLGLAGKRDQRIAGVSGKQALGGTAEIEPAAEKRRRAGEAGEPVEPLVLTADRR